MGEALGGGESCAKPGSELGFAPGEWSSSSWLELNASQEEGARPGWAIKQTLSQSLPIRASRDLSPGTEGAHLTPSLPKEVPIMNRTPANHLARPRPQPANTTSSGGKNAPRMRRNGTKGSQALPFPVMGF